MKRLEPEMVLTPEMLRNEVNQIIEKLEVYDSEQSRLPYKAHTNLVYHEYYIDNGVSNPPYYIIEFFPSDQIEELGDDTYDVPLWETTNGWLTYRNETLSRQNTDRKEYWKPISASDLILILRRFLEMYENNYLQPPGTRDDPIVGTVEHEKLDVAKYIYKLKYWINEFVDLGPQAIFLYLDRISAIKGTIVDVNNQPVHNFAVILLQDNKVVKSRPTNSNGEFLFSKVPSGKYKIRASPHHIQLLNFEEEEFGHVEGTISDKNGKPVKGKSFNLKAPDNEIFSIETDDFGQIKPKSLPALKYLFKSESGSIGINEYQVDLENLTALKGTIVDEDEKPLEGVEVQLLENGSVIKSRLTDGEGTFIFSKISAGRYSIKSRNAFLKELGSYSEVFGTIDGAVTDNSGNPVINTEFRLTAPDDELFIVETDNSGKLKRKSLPALKYIFNPREPSYVIKKLFSKEDNK